MGNINGIPVKWDREADSALLGKLGLSESPFPENSTKYSETETNTFQSSVTGFFSDSLFGNFNFEEEGSQEDDDSTTYVMFRSFSSEEQLNRFFTGVGMDSNGNSITQVLSSYTLCIVCCYISNGDHLKNSIVFRLNSSVGAKLAVLSATDLIYKINFYADKIIDFGKDKGDFYYKKPALIEVLRDAVPVTYTKLKSLKGLSKEKENLYEANYVFFLNSIADPKNQEVEQAVRRLCSLLVILDYDIVETQNRQTVLRPTGNGRKFSLADILHTIRALQKTAVAVNYFQTNDFNNQDEVLEYVNKNFVDPSAIGKETHFVINLPFKKLTYERRKKMLQFFLRNSPLEFSGFFAGAHFDNHRTVSAGDIVYNLLITASDKERLKLIYDFDNDDKDLFYLLNGASGDCFMTISFIVGSAILGDLDTDEKTEKALDVAIKTQNYFFFDDYDTEKKQNQSYDEEKKLIKLENLGHDYSAGRQYKGRGQIIAEGLSGKKDPARNNFIQKEKEYLEKYASPKTYFKPLELIALTAESDIDSTILKSLFAGDKEFTGLKKDDILLLPACIVYLILKEYSDKKKTYKILAISTLVFLPLGITALVGAIKAASTIGILVSVTDVTLDVTVLAVNDPEAMENNKERAEFVNTLAFFWGLARLMYSFSNIKEAAKDANKNLKAALKILLSSGKKVHAGSGGSLKYRKIISRDVLKQEEYMSCAAACIRQLAKDAGIIQSEEVIRKMAGTSNTGTPDLGIIDGLEGVFEGKEVIGSSFFRNSGDITLFQRIVKDQSLEGAWIANIFPQGGNKHAVIVDKVVGNHVYIKDPWPLEGMEKGTAGVFAVVDLKEFSEAWLRANAVSFRIK